MAELIRIGVGGLAEGADLVRALAVRGLTGKLALVEGAPRVEIVSRHEETERLLLDVLALLETWLADPGREPVTVLVGARSLALSFPVAVPKGAAQPARASGRRTPARRAARSSTSAVGATP